MIGARTPTVDQPAVVPGGRLRCRCATCGYPGLWDPARGVVVHWHRRCHVHAGH